MAGGLRLERTGPDEVRPAESFRDHTVFQTQPWLDVIVETQRAQGAQPVYARVVDGDRDVGRFTGLLLKKYGLPILGSPFPGWNTYYMGFNLDPGVERIDALRALRPFSFDELGCAHLEVMDRELPMEQAQQLGWPYTEFHGFEIDLSRPEDELFGGMTSACRRCIRKSERVGIGLEAATDPGQFVDEFYDQLQDVFAKQGLVPTYSKARAMSVVEHLAATNMLLMARARDPDGRSIATGIFVASGDTVFFWSGASWRWGQLLRPNEALHWFAMRYWKERGVSRYDMGGPADYKRKYGGNSFVIPWCRCSRYPGLELLRNVARRRTKLNLARRRHLLQ